MRNFEMTHHLKPLLHWRSTLQVLGSSLDIELNLLLTQVNHMGREERLAVLFKISLVLIEKTIQPWQKLLGTVVGVQDNGDTVCRSDSSDVEGAGNTASDRGLLLVIGNTLYHTMSEIPIKLIELYVCTFPAK
jgi:hypothetical protein